MNDSTRIAHSRPSLGPAEVEAALEVLRSGHLAQGPVVGRFEQAMARWLNRRGGAAVSSGTVALELALRAMGIGPGDEVVMPSYVCAAPWQACSRTGARPVIVDIDRDTFNIDPHAARRALTPKTKAVVVPHMFGLPAQLAELQRLGVPLIEDCAQTLGAHEAGRAAGSVGTVTVCSFYATKLLCAGEGGMVLSDDEVLLDRVRRLRQYDEKPALVKGASNFKMTDLHAAIGLSQLARLPTFLSRRQSIAAQYRAAWTSLPLHLPLVPEGRSHVYFRFVVRTAAEASPVDQVSPLLAEFDRQGLQCRRPVFRPLHRYLGLDGFQRSEQAARTALSVPIYPSMTDEEVRRVIQLVQEACHEVA